MKTHSLAKALRILADVLEASDNTDVSNLSTIVDVRKEQHSKQVAINLKTLHSLSKISKKEWVQLIQDFNFEIEVKPRDSSRDIIGKVLKYLDNNPGALGLLKNKSKNTLGEPSPLRQALDILLEDVDYEKP